MKSKYRHTLFFVASLLLVGCGGGSSNDPVSVAKEQKQAQTVPTLKVTPQTNYTNSDGTLDVNKYQTTQTKYINSK